DVAPALRKAPVTIELFPAFARDGRAQPWRATVRVRFLFRDPQPFGGARDVTVVAGGRAPGRRAQPPVPAFPGGGAPLGAAVAPGARAAARPARPRWPGWREVSCPLAEAPPQGPGGGGGGGGGGGAGADAVRRIALPAARP